MVEDYFFDDINFFDKISVFMFVIGNEDDLFYFYFMVEVVYKYIFNSYI